MNRYFSTEDIHRAKKHVTRCSTSLIIREMQIKTTMRKKKKNYHEVSPHTFQNGHHQKIYKTNKYWRDYEERETLLHCWWKCKLVPPLWRTVWRFLKKLKTEFPHEPAIPLLGLYLEKIIIQKDTCRGLPWWSSG